MFSTRLRTTPMKLELTVDKGRTNTMTTTSPPAILLPMPYWKVLEGLPLTLMQRKGAGHPA